MYNNNNNNNNNQEQTSPNKQQIKQEFVNNVDLSTVSWQNGVQTTMMHRKMKSQRQVEYQVDHIGQVTEEWTILMATENDQTQEQAIHSVYVNGELVRQVNLKTKEVIKKDPKYEPYDFLHYGIAGSNEQHENNTSTSVIDQVPVYYSKDSNDSNDHIADQHQDSTLSSSSNS